MHVLVEADTSSFATTRHRAFVHVVNRTPSSCTLFYPKRCCLPNEQRDVQYASVALLLHGPVLNIIFASMLLIAPFPMFRIHVLLITCPSLPVPRLYSFLPAEGSSSPASGPDHGLYYRSKTP